MKFNRAYSAHALCSPTRASILTGQYPARLRITAPRAHYPAEVLEVEMPKFARPSEKVVPAPTKTRLSTDYHTLGKSLKDAGYATGFFGKWHLGRAPYEPKNFGFDTVAGGGPFPGPPRYFSPYNMGDSLPDGPPGEHIDDRMASESVKFLEANRDRPFFLNLWTWGVHSPFQAKREDIDIFTPKVDPKNPQRSPVYAAMVKNLDDNVGKIIETLDRLNLTDNTLFVFTSDNGGNMFDRLDGTTPTSNAPLRNGKGSIWDGGNRVPLVVAWPGKIKAKSETQALVSSIDFYPTLLQITGAKHKAGQVIDGVDMTPVLRGTGQIQRAAIFNDFLHDNPRTQSPPASSVIAGDWKLIRFYADNDDKSDRFELYNLAQDIGETRNLASQNAEKVRELNALIGAHLKETNALVPFANPRYLPGVSEIDGWKARGDASIRQHAEGLEMVSSGDDPAIFVDDVPAATGPLKVEFRMKSSIAGDGYIFWGTRQDPKFVAARRQIFKPRRNDGWQNYSIEMPLAQSINNLRIDPGTATGTAIFEWIRVVDGAGKTVKEWNFGGEGE